MTDVKNQSSAKSPPWEDALILAFRDLQWIVKQQNASKLVSNVLSLQNNSSNGIVELRQILAKVVQSAIKRPPLLAKLDGNAENGSGDVIASCKGRFFLFEFKASKEALKTEEGKFIFSILKKLGPTTTAEEDFLSLSRRGHHVVYPDIEYDMEGPFSKDKAKGFLPLHKVTLQTRRYFDVVIAEKRECRNTKWFAKDNISAQELMWGEHHIDMGLKVEEMSAYLSTLLAVHKGGGDAHPMKVVVASSDGFFWPGGDLSDLLEMAKYFDDSLAPTPELKEAAKRLHDHFQGIFILPDELTEEAGGSKMKCS